MIKEVLLNIGVGLLVIVPIVLPIVALVWLRQYYPHIGAIVVFLLITFFIGGATRNYMEDK